MREIKFRAWDIDRVEMIPHESLDVYDTEGIIHLFDILNDRSDFIIMQYTGLKDKNGVEIYESDILEVTVHMMAGYDQFGNDYTEAETIYSAVSFKNGSFGIELKPWDCDHINWSELGDKDDYFVIGNIYENKELLK